MKVTTGAAGQAGYARHQFANRELQVANPTEEAAINQSQEEWFDGSGLAEGFNFMFRVGGGVLIGAAAGAVLGGNFFSIPEVVPLIGGMPAIFTGMTVGAIGGGAAGAIYHSMKD